MKICEKCNISFEENVSYCKKCGSLLIESYKIKSNKRKKQNPLSIFLNILLIISGLIFIFGINARFSYWAGAGLFMFTGAILLFIHSIIYAVYNYIRNREYAILFFFISFLSIYLFARFQSFFVIYKIVFFLNLLTALIYIFLSLKKRQFVKLQSLFFLVFLIFFASFSLYVNFYEKKLEKNYINDITKLNNTIELTNYNFANKNELSYNVFEQQLALSPERVRPFYEKAMMAKQLSEVIISYINERKYEMISIVEGVSMEESKNTPLSDMQSKDNYYKPTTYWVGSSSDGSEGKARELKEKIEEYKANMLTLLHEQQREAVNLGLKTKSDEPDGLFVEASGLRNNWEMYNFHYLTTAVQVVNLNKLIAEVRNAEFEVVSALYAGISSSDFKFDKISAMVAPKSQVVKVGDNFVAQIFLAAYDTKCNPEIIVGDDIDTLTLRISGTGQTLEPINGVGFLKMPATSEGRKTYGGVIKVVSPDGMMMPYPFRGEFNVVKNY